MKAYKWSREQINGKWYLVCSSHEHVPMIEKSKDGTYGVRLQNGKMSKNKTFHDAEKIALDIYKKYTKFNRKFEE